MIEKTQPKVIDQIATQNDGLEAFICGHDLLDNPYPEATPQHGYWRHGWLSAQQFSSGGEDE